MELNSIQRSQYIDLVNQYKTPLYVYEGDLIISQIRRLKSAFSGFDHQLLFAAKALDNQTILRLIKREGLGLDAVSINEVELGLLAGFEPCDILFTPSNPSFEDIAKAVQFGVHITLESISALKKFGNRYGGGYPVFIRINPHILAGGNPKIQTGHIDSKFGISIFQIAEILELVNEFGIQVEGLHVHTGSEFLDSGVFLQGAELLFQAATHFPEIRFIDFGSGFKIKNRSDDAETPIEELGRKIALAVGEFNKSRPQPVQIWFEPGKYLVMQSGTLLTRVTTVKKSPTSVFLGVDTGLSHLIRPMFYDAYHPIENISREEAPDHIYSVVGNICETDTLGYNRQLPETSEEDVLAIRNAGAYGFTMASQYNGRFRPAEVLILGGKAHLIRKRETLDDLLKNQINPAIF